MRPIEHSFEPVFDENSKILILGSFPSLKSREMGFYYGHPQNRFWKLLAKVLDTEIPNTIDEKKDLLLLNKIALYDAVSTAIIEGSMDRDLEVVKASDLQNILYSSNIVKIFCNGNKSYLTVTKEMKLEAIKLPSTSAANARYSLDDLYESWKIILEYL